MDDFTSPAVLVREATNTTGVDIAALVTDLPGLHTTYVKRTRRDAAAVERMRKRGLPRQIWNMSGSSATPTDGAWLFPGAYVMIRWLST